MDNVEQSLVDYLESQLKEKDNRIKNINKLKQIVEVKLHDTTQKLKFLNKRVDEHKILIKDLKQKNQELSDINNTLSKELNEANERIVNILDG